MIDRLDAARLVGLMDQHDRVARHIGQMNAIPPITRWRVMEGDSESLDCIGPVCPKQDQHQKFDDAPDITGQYDCCPYPVIECHTTVIAEWLVELLNTAPGLIGALRGARVRIEAAEAGRD